MLKQYKVEKLVEKEKGMERKRTAAERKANAKQLERAAKVEQKAKRKEKEMKEKELEKRERKRRHIISSDGAAAPKPVVQEDEYDDDDDDEADKEEEESRYSGKKYQGVDQRKARKAKFQADRNEIKAKYPPKTKKAAMSPEDRVAMKALKHKYKDNIRKLKSTL